MGKSLHALFGRSPRKLRWLVVGVLATLTAGVPGIFHGQRTIVLSDDDGQIFPAHSVSAGLDYPGVGPEHAHLPPPLPVAPVTP